MRRRKRRTIRPEPVDDLFQLLLEQAAPSTPKQWFEAPWRAGANAIYLGAALLRAMVPSDSQTSPSPIADVLSLARAVRVDEAPSPERVYWHAQRLKTDVTETIYCHLAHEVLELIQKLAANSDGGGFGYNGPLLRMCEAHLASGGALDGIEGIVRRWRGWDVVGGTEEGDPVRQKRLRTFLLAWNQGLFRIAAIV